MPNSHFHSKPSDAHVAQTPHPAVETPPKTTNKTPAPAGGGGAPPSHTQAEAQQIKRARGGGARLRGSGGRENRWEGKRGKEETHVMNSAWSTVAAAVGGFHYLFHASALVAPHSG